MTSNLYSFKSMASPNGHSAVIISHLYLDRSLKPSLMPPIGEHEARACRIISLAPNAVKFIKPVALEVPHFASLRNGERELLILSSFDGGQNWKELAVENGSGRINSYVYG